MYLIAGMNKSAHCSPAWAFSKPRVDTCIHIFSMMAGHLQLFFWPRNLILNSCIGTKMRCWRKEAPNLLFTFPISIAGWGRFGNKFSSVLTFLKYLWDAWSQRSVQVAQHLCKSGHGVVCWRPNESHNNSIHGHNYFKGRKLICHWGINAANQLSFMRAVSSVPVSKPVVTFDINKMCAVT